MTKILQLANDFSTLYNKYNNEIIQHVLIENTVIDAGLIGNNHVSTANVIIDNTNIRIGTTRGLLDNDLLAYDALQYKFVNKSLAEFGFVGAADIANSITTDTLTANTISVSGDLVVAGNTITLDTQTLLVEDNIVVFGANNAADITDLGFAGEYNNGVNTLYAGIFRDASDGKFYVFKDYPLEPPTSTLTGFNVNSMKATLVGNFEAIDSIQTPQVISTSDLDINAGTNGTVYIDAQQGGGISMLASGTIDITSGTSGSGDINLAAPTGDITLYASGSIAPQTSIIPSGSIDLGSSGNPWNNIYVDDLTLNTAAIAYNAANGTLDVSGNALAYQSDVATLIENSYASFTAQENIDAGNTVSILSNSSIENIKRTTITGAGLLNNNFTPTTSLTDVTDIKYDKTLAKLLVCYQQNDSGVYRYKAALASIDSLGNITFGNEIEIIATSSILISGSPKGAIDPIQNRAVFIYMGNLYVAEISGNNLVNLQSPVQFNSNGWYYSNVIYHSSTEQFVLAYAAKIGSSEILRLRTAKVIGNSVTIGTEFNANHSGIDTDNINLSIDKDTNKVIVGWRSGGSLRSAIASISGTSISMPLSGITATYFEVYNAVASYTKLIYTSDSTVVAVFGDLFNSNRGYYSIGTISGSTITYGTPLQFTTAAINNYIGLAYDNVTERIAINYRGSNGNLGPSIGTIENGAINFETTFQTGTVGTTDEGLYLTVDETNNFFISGGETLVYSYEANSFSTNIDTFIGIAKDTITQGQTGKVYVVGDIADNQTGLLPGEYYYLKNDGTLTTSSTEYGIAGIALTSTSIKLLQALPNSLTDLNITDGSIGQFLKTNGEGGFDFSTINLSTLRDVNVTSNANQVLIADGTGNFNFNTVDYNNLINKPDAQLASLADDAFINSIIFG